jgi:hypothetical protein
MPCLHRFQNDLHPAGELNYLFVGTFNPAWNRVQGDDANWFYGRQYNDFWFIMPQVFGHESLMPAEFRNNREFLIDWCFNNNIGITDLISEIADADINLPTHQNLILGLEDDAFDNFNQIIPTDICSIINANRNSLRGIYLTRYEHTLAQGGILHQLWQNVKLCCSEHEIRTSALVTPSRNYRTINRVEKLNRWIEQIHI